MTAEILQIIRRAGRPLSKKDISLASGLSISGVVEHVDRLIDTGLLVNTSIGQSSGGRKPRLYAFNKDAGCLVSIDMETDHAKIAITDFDCNILIDGSCSFDILCGPESVLLSIKDQVVELLNKIKVDKNAVKGIGIGIPDVVDFAEGLLVSPLLMPGWDRYPIRDFWSGHLDCPCYVDNDVNIIALGEYAKGLNFQVANMIVVKVGTGIGAGIICNGKLYRGSDGSAGDLGHFDMGIDVTCWCGNRGCLEAAAGGKAIVAKAKEATLSGRSVYLKDVLAKKDQITLQDIAYGIQRLDGLSIELIRESSVLTGRAVASIVNFINPELVLVAGAYPEFDDTMLASVRQGVYQRSLPLATRNLLIKKSVLGHQAGLIGAAYMTVERLILGSINDEEDAVIAAN
ncbi:ROK family transcriptional regulator [Cohnella kolymensis]|uniref:ROK family transcriptional regulator n=1 Tax=Cohnella kolymensis TaxID=1590652 RepID=UPI000697B152|nr:ROK family transcriptional regulator [Cohnella kolymensis]